MKWRMRMVCAAILVAAACPNIAVAGLRWDFAQRPGDSPPSEGHQSSDRAVAVCHVSAKGEVSDCRTLMEDPPENGASKVLLSRAPLYRMRPRPKSCARVLDKVALALDF